MNTTENNKLIADFMKYKIALGTKDEYVTPFTIAKWEDVPMFSHSFHDKEYNVENEHRIDEMLFHSDWNWLMSVVEKIEGLGHGVTIYKKGCHINNEASFTTNGFNHSSKIEQTYNAVVEFIKWYNLNKSK